MISDFEDLLILISYYDKYIEFDCISIGISAFIIERFPERGERNVFIIYLPIWVSNPIGLVYQVGKYEIGPIRR